MKMTVQCAAARHAQYWTKQCDAENERGSDLRKSVYLGYKAASLPDDTVGSCPNQSAANP
jgi:hypothetical protein